MSVSKSSASPMASPFLLKSGNGVVWWQRRHALQQPPCNLNTSMRQRIVNDGAVHFEGTEICSGPGVRHVLSGPVAGDAETANCDRGDGQKRKGCTEFVQRGHLAFRERRHAPRLIVDERID